MNPRLAPLQSLFANASRAMLAALVAVAAAGCEGPLPVDDPAVAARASALGETVGDRPSYPERLALYACNRARVDPAAIGWKSFAAVPPLQWHDGLAQSARAHSIDMRDTPCFQHASCDGSDPFERIKRFFTDPAGALGENILAGVDDAPTAIHNWIEEIGAPPGETGHRENMFGKGYDLVGFGYAAGGTRFRGYWTQDFAGTGVPRAHLASGSHFPETVAAGMTVKVGTTFYDAAGAAPERIEVVVDGAATPLKLVAGTPSMGAYEGSVTVAAGCHRYFFRAFVGGKGSAYPDAGTLALASAGAPTCATYVPGGVSLMPGGDPGAGMGGNGGGGSDGGCGGGVYRGPQAQAASPLLFVLLPLALLRRRRP